MAPSSLGLCLLTVTPLLNNMVLDKKITRTPRSQTFKCVTRGKPLLLLLDQAKPFSYFNKILNEMVLSEVSEVACDYMELVKAPEEAHLVKGVTEAAFQEERWIYLQTIQGRDGFGEQERLQATHVLHPPLR